MPVPELTTIWEFQVKSDALAKFEAIYGPEGDWAQLFRRSPEYRGTVLVRDADRRGRYLTIDHWISREALQQFKRDYHADYAALDQK
jgi:hypothetical protein